MLGSLPALGSIQDLIAFSLQSDADRHARSLQGGLGPVILVRAEFDLYLTWTAVPHQYLIQTKDWMCKNTLGY